METEQNRSNALINPLHFFEPGSKEAKIYEELLERFESGKTIDPLYFFKAGSKEAKIYEERLKRLVSGELTKVFTIEGGDETSYSLSMDTGFSQNQIAVIGNVSMVKAQEHSKLLDFPTDDTGNVDRVFMRFGEVILFNPNSGKFYVWNKKVWQIDETRQVKKMCEKVMQEYRLAAEPYRHCGDEHLQECFHHSKNSCNNGRLNALVEMLKHRTAKVSEDLDTHLHLLNAKNGVISLHNGYLQPHDKDLYMTQYVDTDYVPNAHIGSLFEAFVNSICGGDLELVGYLQKVLGYAITGETKEQAIFFLLGNGSNGKTTLLEAVGSVVEDYIYHIPISVLLDSSTNQAGRPSPELAKAVNARILVCSESNEKDFLNEGKVKMLTGETTISVRNLYCEPFEMKPKFTILIDTNHLPKIKGRDFAIWRRLKVIPFMQTFSGRNVDKYLSQKLRNRQEQEAILSWLVEGAVRYYKEGISDIPSIIDATASYKKTSDSIQAFMEYGVEYGKNLSCSASDLYAAYKAFCADQELEPISNTGFGSALSENGFEKVRTAAGVRYKGMNPKEVYTMKG